MATVYRINKGVNRAVVFKGLKAQYITFLAVGLVSLLLVFTALYLLGFHLYLCLGLVLLLGTALFISVYRLSLRFGQHGLMKWWARRRLPRTLRVCSRKPFLQLKNN